MRIGLYGGMANNLYLHGKALAGSGYEVLFIRERDDAYPFSQPFWEDLELTLGYQEVRNTAAHAHERWSALEAAHGWKAPDWLWDPLPLMVEKANKQAFRIAGMGYSEVDAAIVEQMRSCDGLLVCGAKAAILADYSGRPFVIQPAGADIMVAARLLRLQKPGWPWQWLFGTPYERAVRNAFLRCRAIGVHDPKVDLIRPLRSNWGRPRARLPTSSFRLLATHTNTAEPLDDDTRAALRDELSRTLGVRFPDNRKIILVPSRVDFEWKGHDRLAKAFRDEKIARSTHFIFCAWGEDFQKLKELSVNGQWSVTLLDIVLSKPLLYKLMAAVDIVIDNFVSGHYGATGAEAMGRGTPVLMWCDPKQYTHPPGIPPVLQARTAKQIQTVLLDYLDGRIDIAASRQAAYRWSLQRHSAPATTRMLFDLLK